MWYIIHCKSELDRQNFFITIDIEEKKQYAMRESLSQNNCLLRLGIIVSCFVFSKKIVFDEALFRLHSIFSFSLACCK